MSTNEILHMITTALQAMLVGIPGVFLVLAVFYFVIKLMMLRPKAPPPEAQDTEDRGGK